jgi:hypothetical protein
MRTLMTRDRSGMGADPTPGAVCWTDTGAGITPANYQDQCCGFFGSLKPSCIQWTYENSDLFHGDATDPCSDGAAVRLKLSIPGCLNVIPPLPTAPAPPVIDPTTGEALTPSGQPINSAADANAVLDSIIKATSEADKAQIRAWMAAQAKTQCGSQATICGNNTLFRKVSADCTDCAFDFSNSTFWLGAIGLVVATIVVVKLT